MTRFGYLSVGLALLGVVLMACPASAAIMELEPNNTLATATTIISACGDRLRSASLESAIGDMSTATAAVGMI